VNTGRWNFCPQRLTIPLRVGHAEIAPYLLLGAAPFQVADSHDFLTVEAGQATGHGEIVAKGSIPVDLRKVSKNTLDEVHRVGPLRVPREFGLDPGGIRRFGDYLCLLKICWCRIGHETLHRLCQRGKVCRLAFAFVDCMDYSGSTVAVARTKAVLN
jgi:hypothetical protein